MAVNKVVFGSETIIDLTGDTVDASHLLAGITAHDKSGEAIEGSCSYDSDTSDATVAVAEMLAGKTAYARGAKVTGTMPNIGSQDDVIDTKAQEVAISQGYHDGSGKIAIAADEQAKILPANIKMGVDILGVTGTLEPSSDVTAQSKSVNPGLVAKNVLPDEGYDYLSQVTVAAIGRTDTENAAGGTTVTIGG